MKKRQSLDRRMMISKNSILMLVLLVTVFIAVWAWFVSSSDTATATGLSASTQTPATLQMALPDEDGNAPQYDSSYSSSINFDEKIDILRTMTSDVTSDGVYFIVPETDQSNGVRQVLEEGSWSRAKANEDYIYIPFYVRSEDPNILVSKNSKLEATLKDTKGIVNQSDAGEFSRNAIVGAMRVSILNVTDSLIYDENNNPTWMSDSNYQPDGNNIKLTWIPRPDLQLDTSQWVLNQNVQCQVNSETGLPTTPSYIHSYCMINDSDRKSLYYGNGTGSAFKQTTYPNAVASPFIQEGVTPTLGKDVKIGDGKLTSTEQMKKTTFGDKQYYLYKFVMNIWIEGEDTEARRALNNGEFSLDIKFNAEADNS